jgi:hypothetical protein
MTKEIVWFNVRGESVCLLKSTILDVIPKSRLAERVTQQSSSTSSASTTNMMKKGTAMAEDRQMSSTSIDGELCIIIVSSSTY